jgi:hypothetical protein
MKATMLLFCLVIGLFITSTSLSVAQGTVPASQDTIVIVGNVGHEGELEATINGDTTALGARIHPNRVYKLQKNSIYTQYSAIDIKNPTGALIIVGERGGTKPVIIYTGINGVDPGNATTGEVNVVQGSIKMENVHVQCKFTNDGLWRNNLFSTSTANSLPQYVDVKDCMFEFMMLDLFSSDGYTAGAKFRFSNCYFRNFFNPNQWWGGRVWYCKRAIDTVWVENCTVTGGGLIFLNQSSLTKFAYYNHNTIINSNKYWQLGVYYLEGYWTNNLFINQNWVGEDYYNVATGGQDPDPGYLMGNFGLDTLTVQSGKTKPHINVQADFLLADSTIDPSKCGLDKIKAFVSNNILWTDTVALEAYYKDKAVGGFGPYGGAFPGECPSSWLTWTAPANPPTKVVNVPGIWMNPRTAGLFSGTYPLIVQKDNLVNVKVETVTPAIASAAVANQMALWDAGQWGVPGITPNTITESGYIFGDFSALTIPGIKTEDGDGITKFTDFNENWAQSGTVKLSTIDQKPIGALHWVDADIAAYNSATAYANVIAAYQAAASVKSFVDNFDNGVLDGFVVDASSADTYSITETGGVLNVAYHRTGTTGHDWNSIDFTPPALIQPACAIGNNGKLTYVIKSSLAVTIAVKPIYATTDDWLTFAVPGDNAWHKADLMLSLGKIMASPINKFYIYVNGGVTTAESATIQIDSFKVFAQNADPSGVDAKNKPVEFALEQNYPNPFNPSTTINFTLAKASDVKLAVYNVLGQKVATLVDTRMSAGQQSVVFDASRLASGVYFYHIDAGSFTSVKKMLLMK